MKTMNLLILRIGLSTVLKRFIDKGKLNGEYDNTSWTLNDKDNIPMVAVNYTMNLKHALYPEYGKIAWDFFKHYSRDQKSGDIMYNPYAK
jgi:hypothetical protein